MGFLLMGVKVNVPILRRETRGLSDASGFWSAPEPPFGLLITQGLLQASI